MIIKCPNCAGVLEYDVASQKLLCQYCFSYYEPSLFEHEERKEEKRVGNWNLQGISEYWSSYMTDNEYMDTEIYSCTACGAELMINNVEMSTFCAYCGQPTIVFDRLAKSRKPDYIIPFTISREDALRRIRKKFSSGTFISDETQKFKPEMVRGIYIPYWMFDFESRQMGLFSKSKDCTDKKENTYRECVGRFQKIKIEASKRFNDEYSKYLEPFDVEKRVPFRKEYLSGFYSDCGDDNKEKMAKKAIVRVRKMMEEKIMEELHIYAWDRLYYEKLLHKPAYILLPVWFVIFTEQNVSYTVLVNGQTGKVIGGIPYNKKKEKRDMFLLSILYSIVFGLVFAILLKTGSYDMDGFLVIWLLELTFTLSFFFKGRSYRKKLGEKKALTTENLLKKMVSERQGES